MPYKDKNSAKAIESRKRASAKYWKVHSNELREKRRKQYEEFRKANPDKIKVYKTKYYQKHREEILLKLRNGQPRKPKSTITDYERQRKYKDKTPDYYTRQVKGMWNSYLRKNIIKDTNLKSADIPQELVELYKLKLIAERMLRNGTS